VEIGAERDEESRREISAQNKEGDHCGSLGTKFAGSDDQRRLPERQPELSLAVRTPLGCFISGNSSDDIEGLTRAVSFRYVVKCHVSPTRPLTVVVVGRLVSEQCVNSSTRRFLDVPVMFMAKSFQRSAIA
jgi:hypothetical protein